jgi:hypothetical protein
MTRELVLDLLDLLSFLKIKVYVLLSRESLPRYAVVLGQEYQSNSVAQSTMQQWQDHYEEILILPSEEKDVENVPEGFTVFWKDGKFV